MNQYDVIGGHWETTADIPMFAAVQRNLPRLAGDVRGLDVLDVATGTGVYARMWAAAGARRVVGTDRSEEMVAAARRISGDERDGITYAVADGAEHPDLGPFDLVTAAFLLNYARDAETLTAMTRALYANLRPGGRLVGTLPRPDFPLDGSVDLAPFGIRVVPTGGLAVGPAIRLTVLTDPPFGFDCAVPRRDVIEAALREAGFTTPRWLPGCAADPDHPSPEADRLAEAGPIVLFETARPA